MKIRICIPNSHSAYLNLNDEDVNCYRGQEREDFIGACVREHVLRIIGYSWRIVSFEENPSRPATTTAPIKTVEQ